MVKQGILAEVHPLQEETANGASDSFTSQGENLGIAVYASAVGTSLDLEVQWSPDGVNFGSADTSADSFAQLTAAGTAALSVSVKAPFYRIAWTLSGNATFLVTAH